MARHPDDLIPLDQPHALGDRQPPGWGRLFGDDLALLRATLAVWLLVTVWKIVIARFGNVIWEEAHFAVLGQHPNLGYADVPAGWPLFARLCTDLVGWSPFGLRLCGLLVAQAIPLGVFFLAEPLVGRRQALWAALLSLLIPALTASGTVFYPEGGLQLLTALMLGCGVRAVRSGRLAWWALTGLCGGLGLFVHYRFLLVGGGVLLFTLVTPEGRRLWAQPGLYLAGALAAVGLLPSAAYNATSGWPSLAFHLANRPSYAQGFDLRLLVAFLVQQAGLTTPLIFIGLLAGAWRAGRRLQPDQLGARMPVWAGAAVFGLYLVLSPKDRQIMPHWPFLAYVAWSPFLPSALIGFADAARNLAGRRVREALIGLGPILALAAGIAGTGFEWAWTKPQVVPARYRGYLFSKLEDWRQVEPALAQARAEAIRRFPGGEPALAAAGHISALRLEFPGKPGRQVYALAEPYDEFSRFGVMRSRWGLDEAALRRRYAGRGTILVLPEPSYLYHTRGEAAFRQRLCGEFDDLAPIETVEMPPGRTAVEIYIGRVRAAPASPGPGPCVLFPPLYLAHPVRADVIRPGRQDNQFGVAADPKGVRSVDVYVDGRMVSHARYGLEAGWISDALRYDPNYPRVQFDFQLPPASLTPGAHRVWLRATRPDGSSFDGAWRTFYVP